MEIEKMSDEILINEITILCIFHEKSELIVEYKQELLKRLSKNNISEFKNKLIEEIKNDYVVLSTPTKQHNVAKRIILETKKYIINLINNIGKE